jgi:hypothetical protein
MSRWNDNGYDDATTGRLARPTDIPDAFDRHRRYDQRSNYAGPGDPAGDVLDGAARVSVVASQHAA